MMVIQKFLGRSSKFTKIAFISSVPVLYLFIVPFNVPHMLVWSSKFTLMAHNILDHAMNFFEVIL